jgi:15-cis-phytoene synthase
VNTIATSYRHCRDIVRRAGSNFPLAFRLLPPAGRRAMDALYAFMRLTDDLADDAGDVDTRRERLRAWRSALAAALAGESTHAIHPALADAVRTFGIDPHYLHAVIDGVERDLEPVAFATFDELAPYCRLVASAVGLACLPVWGCVDPRAAGPADAAGIAFQLTNILRDLGEDRARGRVYLPADELARFGCPPATWDRPGPAFRELLRFQVDRAREYYGEAARLDDYLSRSGRAIYRTMHRTYRELLDEIDRRGTAVLTARVSVPKRRKLAIFAAAWPVKWGWVR